MWFFLNKFFAEGFRKDFLKARRNFVFNFLHKKTAKLSALIWKDRTDMIYKALKKILISGHNPFTGKTRSQYQKCGSLSARRDNLTWTTKSIWRSVCLQIWTFERSLLEVLACKFHCKEKWNLKGIWCLVWTNKRLSHKSNDKTFFSNFHT